jgi:hypothetical protein
MPAIAERRGHMVKTSGYKRIAEFGSVDAVRSGVALRPLIAKFPYNAH